MSRAVIYDRVFRALFAPELTALAGVPQDAEWHPEGDAHVHTSYVISAAVRIARRDRLDDRDAEVLLLAALCHDLGKASCTTHDPDGRIRSRGHDVAGEAPTRALLGRLGVAADVIDAVVALVLTHMAERQLRDGGRSARRKLAVQLLDAGVTPAQWARILEADHSGRPPLPPEAPGDVFVAELEALQRAEIDRRNTPEPIVGGRELIDAGLMPVPPQARGALIRELFVAQLRGEFTDLDGGLQVARRAIARRGVEVA